MSRAPLAALSCLLVACGAGAPSYAGCTDDLDCAEATDTCYRLIFDRSDGSEADGNLCSRDCTSDSECGADASCISLAGDPSMRFFCAARCTVSSDCYADFVCTPLDSMDSALCLP